VEQAHHPRARKDRIEPIGGALNRRDVEKSLRAHFFFRRWATFLSWVLNTSGKNLPTGKVCICFVAKFSLTAGLSFGICRPI